MAKITVLLYNNQRPFHFCSHIEAIITDQASERTFKIKYASFARQTNAKDNQETLSLTEQNNGWAIGSVTLFSDMPYDQFILNYYHLFGNLHRYHYVKNNCADAVSYALDYFFPDKQKTDWFCHLYQMACCWLCLGTCGVKYFPTPIGILSPYDVYQKAKWLSDYYGSVPEPEDDAETVCVCQQAGWDEQRLSDPDFCDNALSLAIANGEVEPIKHFLQAHLASFNAKHLAYAYLLLLAQNRPHDAKALTTYRPADFACLQPDEKTEEKTSLLPEKAPHLQLLARYSFTRSELRLLVWQAIEYDMPLSFIAPLCEHQNSLIFTAQGCWERKLMSDYFNPYNHALAYDRQEIAAYFKLHAFSWFTDYVLGLILLDIIHDGDFAKATQWLTAKPGIDKTWHYNDTQRCAIHLVAASPQDDITLFKLLAESRPCADLTKKIPAGENVLGMATQQQNIRITRYLVENHAKLFPEHIELAKTWLATLPPPENETKAEPVETSRFSIPRSI